MRPIGPRAFLANILRAFVFVFAFLMLTAIVSSRMAGNVDDDWPKAILFYAFTWGMPIVVAAMLHQGILIVLLVAFDLVRHQRVLAVLLAVVFPIVFAVASTSAATVAHPLFLVPIVVGAMLYAGTMNLGNHTIGSVASSPDS